MKCQKCNSKRVMSVGGKVSDMFNADNGKMEYQGYVPDDLEIGSGDYIEFDYCLNCGQIQGNFPLPETGLENGDYSNSIESEEE